MDGRGRGRRRNDVAATLLLASLSDRRPYFRPPYLSSSPSSVDPSISVVVRQSLPLPLPLFFFQCGVRGHVRTWRTPSPLPSSVHSPHRIGWEGGEREGKGDGSEGGEEDRWMEEGMREEARQQRTIEARERATNEEARKEGRNNMPRLSPTTAANVRRSFGRGRFSSSAAPLSLLPSLVNGGKGRKKKR